MRVKLFPLFVVCLICAFSTAAQTVDEKHSSIQVKENGFEVSLSIDSPDEAPNKKINLEIINLQGDIKGNTTQNIHLKKGKNRVSIMIPTFNGLIKGSNELPWFRLRYTMGTISKTVSFSQLIGELFELRIVSSGKVFSAMNYGVRVKAVHPFTGSPIANVRINGKFSLGLNEEARDEIVITDEETTDKNGIAELKYVVPPGLELDDNGTLSITGVKNGLTQIAETDLDVLLDGRSFMMLTDKPIYQPEQMLNIRGILMAGRAAKTIVPEEEVEFQIEDEDSTILYREKVVTSSFGLAFITWQIPANAKLGRYRIRIRGNDNETISSEEIKISRYDLPNFTVAAKALKPYYLQSDSEAEIEVRADYLFGRPVLKGKVRVVRETDRRWNWKEQKYDIEEGEAHEGVTDAEGKFKAKFNLKEDQEDFADDTWRKFQDLNFTAYYTDLTTNRTEQRRFDVRLTHEKIHVYYTKEENSNHADLPVTGYITTFYADGTPAECSVTLEGSEDDNDDKKYKKIAITKTNKFGIGKVEYRRPKVDDLDDDLYIKLTASDDRQNSGTFEDDISFSENNALQVYTDNAIYKPGEQMNVNLVSTIKNGKVFIEVLGDWSVISTFSTDLKNGRGELTIPYQPEFSGELKIGAYIEDSEDEDEVISGTRGVIFPAPQNLKVEASFNKAVYKPGDDGKADFSVLDSMGRAVESVLGIVIFDSAVEERARTDAEFSGMFRNYGNWFGYGQSFGGVNIKDIYDLDLSKPISSEMQLSAAAIFSDVYYEPDVFRSKSYFENARSVFRKYFAEQFEPIAKILNKNYEERHSEHPTDDASLYAILNRNGVDFPSLRDPWEMGYKAEVTVDKARNVLTILSAGADKIFGTSDDIIAATYGFNYFTEIGKQITQADIEYHKRTGGYIREEATLLKGLGRNELLDRFGRPYKIFFEVSGRFYDIRVRSIGKDGKYDVRSWQGDDFDLWSTRTDYFAGTDEKIDNVLRSAADKPRTKAMFIKVLAANGIEFEQLRDGYDKPLYLDERHFSRFTDRVTTERLTKYGETTAIERQIITPVTQDVVKFSIRGSGPDGREGTYDDVTMSEYQIILSEQTKEDTKPRPVMQNIRYSKSQGSIAGIVTDSNGAGIPAAIVTATNETTQVERKVITNDDGRYMVANLQPGKYTVRIEFDGFQTSVFINTAVNANGVTLLDVVLQVGSVSSAVEVSASTESTVDISSSSISANQVAILPKGANMASLLMLKPGVSVDPADANSTPRLREYFPETLVWNPEVVTDFKGKAEIKFKMADNITTWKLYTIASTKSGKVGFVTKDITAFQPFFVDLDPPKFLTNGDEISLPVQVRNYTDRKQSVDVSMAKGEWFSLLGSDKQTVEVASGNSQNAVFGFKATSVVKDGKQNVKAIADTDSDAIEKPVTVRPNGQEIIKTDTRLFNGSETLEVNFPGNAIPKTQQTELKIYPNLFSHVAESVDGLLRRPYGCGEQTISSTYPNLMILKFKNSDSVLRTKARKYLQKGYERLLGYQAADGGFTYWGGNETPDIALTAYALRFLKDAKSVIAVDESVIKRAEDWLIKQQRADGSWTVKYYYEKTEDLKRTKMLTTYLARSLAMRVDNETAAATKTALQKALDYLKTLDAEIDEPYALALFGLASFDSGDTENAKKIAARLETLAIAEGSSSYWNLETNTPFYGWGTAGRIETTALVTQLLLKVNDGERKSGDAISRGILFLLKNKDQFGVWYSTQTTINVLDAFIASLANDSNGKAQEMQVFLNGENVQTLKVSADQIAPLTLDLSSRLNASANSIEVRSADTSPVMMQVVAGHYIDWSEAKPEEGNINQSRALRLDYKCDDTDAAIMQEVTCRVEAERIGFQGYGMLLAEIGIPPGADISRESLEKAVINDGGISRYEILPDRIILYMWAKAGGNKVDFKFRPRYGINAQTPASVVYDYYNPEAQAIVAPMKFIVK